MKVRFISVGNQNFFGAEIMAVEVYVIDGKDYGKLDKLLAADPYAKDSFKTVG